MLKEEFTKHGIIDWWSTEMAINDLYSMTERDPCLIAESMGYDMAEDRPFHVYMFITANDTVMPYILIFKDYRSKVKFVTDNQILNIEV